jgi:hypothetical protein
MSRAERTLTSVPLYVAPSYAEQLAGHRAVQAIPYA